MNEAKKHSQYIKRMIMQGIILIFVTLFTCLMLCGCSANNTDERSSDNNRDAIRSNDTGGTSASASTESDGPNPEDNSSTKDSSASKGKNDQPPVVKNKDLHSAGISLPLKESQVISISVESEYMKRKMPCRVYLPKGYGDGEAHPVWYGLHGYSSNETMWLNEVEVAAASDKLIEEGVIRPMIMVFPFTRDATLKEINEDLEDDGKFGERNMDRFMCEELVPYMDSRYDTAASAGDRYIGGFSMGGMIALRIAFHHPDLFSKVGGYSAAVISSDYSDRQLEEWLFPYDNVNEVADIVEFDKQKGLDRLTVYLNCGTNNDPFLTGLQSLYEALQKRGIPAEFDMYKGGHDLEYSKANINKYLMFYAAKH